jgi:hypothetical protein
MSESNGPARSVEAGIGYPPETQSYPTRPRNVAIWIDHRTAVLQAFWASPPEHFDPVQTGGPARAASGSWWEERIQARQEGPLQQYMDAIVAHLAPGDEVLILGPDERKQDLCQQIDASEGRYGHVVGVCDAADLSSAEVIVPVSHVLLSSRMVPEGHEQGPAPHHLAVPREMDTG